MVRCRIRWGGISGKSGTLSVIYGSFCLDHKSIYGYIDLWSRQQLPQITDKVPLLPLMPPHLILHLTIWLKLQRKVLLLHSSYWLFILPIYLCFLYSSYTSAPSPAFFPLYWDSPISKANILTFWKETPTGKSLKVICKCLIEPQRNFLFTLFLIWLLLMSAFASSTLTRPFTKHIFRPVFHPGSSHNYIFVNLLFYHCLPSEGCHYFYIILLLVWFIFLGVDWFFLQEF